jgi:hypothetical protein
MRGTMLIFSPHEKRARVIAFEREPTLEEVREAIGGGFIEKVPGFNTIAYQGVVMDCVALCDEHGKIKQLETNNWATLAWDQALRRAPEGGGGLVTSTGRVIDYLCGTVLVLFGDREFREAL